MATRLRAAIIKLYLFHCQRPEQRSGARLNDSWDRTSSIVAHGLTNSLRRLRLHHRIALQPGSGPPEPTRRPADCRDQTLYHSVDRISSSLLQMMTHQCRQRLDKVLVIIE